MKKQLLEFLSFNHGRLLFLAMMLFIGQGVAISQGIKTVTTDANDGDGSLRQTIAEAVDGDVIIFDGAITTITVDSSLMLGDKTLTIDGGGDVVLNRNLVAIDSFRLVTITGVADKLVTIKNLTIQNGLSKEAGGGLLADHDAGGQTMLEKVVFKDNFALGSGGDTGGGGVRIVGYNEDTVSMATDCEFINNSLPSGKDGAGAHAENAVFLRCSFTGNEADAGGGARAQGNVLFDNCTFTDNSASDDGGAIRLSSGSVTALNCKFEGNSAGDNGGGVFMARGSVINCEFINNTSVDLGGAVFANNNAFVINSLLSGNSSGEHGGGICIDDEGIVENCIIKDNTAGVLGGGVWFKGGGDVGNIIGSVIANNAADSIGGGIHLATGNVINCVVTNNYSAENGGAISGDGTWLIANSIVFGNDAAGDDKNIQVVSNGAALAATNCAIDATGYNAAAWTASNITTLDASPFVGGSEADSLMLASGSALIDAGDITGIEDLIPEKDLNGVKRIINGSIDLGAYEKYVTLVVTTDADNGAGSLRQAIADAVDGDNIITFADDITTIKVDQPLELGDSTLTIDGGGDVVLDGAFSGDPALDIYRIFTITGDSARTVTIKNLTIQNGVAAAGADGGGLLADHGAGGQTMLDNLVFKDNMADDMGGAVAITGYNADTVCMVTNTEFVGNTSVDDGGAAVATNAMFDGCTFTENRTGDNGGAVRADSDSWFDNCTFTGNIADGAGGAVRVSDETAGISNSVFDSNSAAEAAGAVFMARGTVTSSVFTNNTAVGDGGAIFANNDSPGPYIDDCHFTGNSAASGGAVYVDDEGHLYNSIITDNSATVNGGGVFLEGNGGRALMVGCVLANNTADGNGGGVYVQDGDVINSIITENYAGTNGGAFTGETGPWFMANTVVWNNDAAGAEKNIEVVSNSATDHAANCAIDATAYNDGAWTATDISTLDASPFVGGSGNDSLYSASVKLIDAGTLEYGILDLLPEMDLDGNARIQTALDIGAYEAEIISVLGISLDRSTLEVGVGEMRTINATVAPDFASDKSITWSSSDESIATVDGGNVTGVASGSATITATTVDGGFTATCEVTVRNAVTGVTLNEEAISLEVAETFTLVATVAPADATNQAVSWVSGDEDVATVTVDGGVVTAVAPGTATITVVTIDGGFIATCEVTVTEATVAVTGVSLDQTTLALEPAGTATLVATVAPEDATDKSVSWSSSDDGVATVADGVVTAVADGTCTITVTTTDGGLTATCEVTVESVGIEQHEAGFNLYPNPVSGGRLFIEVTDPAITAFEIYNVLGVVIHQEHVYTQTTYELDTPDMQKSGIYFIRMIKDQTISVEQFIVE